MVNMKDSKAVVLFSGGLDSSLATCHLIEQGYDIELLHYDTGALISNSLSDIRYNELQFSYPKCTITLHKLKSYGSFRKIALTTLESDIMQYQVSLICVGCKLAIHIETIIYCLNHGIHLVADGSTKKQNKYGEQRLVALEFIRQLYKKYGIEYCTPIYEYEKTNIKYALFDRNITIQSLEDTCLFSRTFSTASNEAIEAYLKSKLLICYELIERGTSYEKNR